MKKGLFLNKGRKQLICAIAAFLILFMSLYLSVVSFKPPKPKPANVPPGEFSSGRSMKHLTFIAREPHPIESTFHVKVRDYIFEYLKSINLEPEIQEAKIWSRTIYNLMVKIKGKSSGKAVLLLAHYDSVPLAPGASDDGAAVAAMMEIARILSSRLKLKNDVILLFTDAEEVSMLGARAFVKEHPWIQDVGLVFNFEARGCCGPVLMFESSENNGWIIENLAETAPFVFANSLIYRIYKMFPLDGDFTIFKKEGLTGLDFAYIDGSYVYHRPGDNVHNIDEASIQNHGKIMLNLIKHFGNLDLSKTEKKDRMFFNFLNLKLVNHPLSWGIPLSVLNIFFFMIITVTAIKRKETALIDIVKGFFFVLVNLVYIMAFLVVIMQITSFSLGSKLWAIKYCDSLFFIGFMSFTLAVNRFLYIRFRKKHSVLTLSLAGLLFWLILSILSTLFFSEGSFLFTWPLLLLLVGTGVTFLFRKLKHQGPANLIIFGTCSFTAVAIVFPIIHMLIPGFTLNRLSAILTSILFTLVLTLINPLLSYNDYPRKWLLPLSAAVIGIVFLISGILTAGNYLDFPIPPVFFNIPYLCY